MLAALWLFLAGTPYENTLWLAATGKIDLSLSLFYRFRDSTIALDGSWGDPGTKLFLSLCSRVGVRAVWIASIVLQAITLRKRALAIQFTALLVLFAGLLWGDALLSWNLLFTLLVILSGRTTAPRRGAALVVTLGALTGYVCCIGLVWSLANPARCIRRQRVLGGSSYLNTFKPRAYHTRIELKQNCLAVINPEDLHGINSVELLSRSTLASFTGIILLDLKIVETNYRFLTFKDEQGEFLFSNDARAFAEKEQLYAASVRNRIESAASLCLIAPFDRLPEQENPPYSRARQILDARRRAGLPTQIIQLPAND